MCPAIVADWQIRGDGLLNNEIGYECGEPLKTMTVTLRIRLWYAEMNRQHTYHSTAFGNQWHRYHSANTFLE